MHLHRRSSRRRFAFAAVRCAVFVAAVTPAAVSAQADGTSRLWLTVAPGLTRTLDVASGTLSAEAAVGLGGHLRVGGSVTHVLRALQGGQLRSGQAGGLRVGYGGALIEVVMGASRAWGGGVVIGGGHMTMTDPVTGTQTDADSFTMIEPRVSWMPALSRHVTVITRLSHRWVSGLVGIDGLRSDQLHGISGAIGFAVKW